MEQEKHQLVYKTVLRNLQSKKVHRYLIPKHYKEALNYPQNCLEDLQHMEQLQQLLPIDCEMIKTDKGDELVRVIIIGIDRKICYDKWFIPVGEVIDYVTHITGITKQTLQRQAKSPYQQKDKEEIQSTIKSKILVGHDLSNDLKVLKIRHNAFIDTLYLYPHNYGLPFKTKLKQLSMQLLRKPIQWSYHDPYEDALTALQIVEKHISEGKGTIQEVQTKFRDPSQFKDIWSIIEQAELDRQKIQGLFLRGSQALGLQIDVQGYKSDWDYVCVYNTSTKINGRLIKLPEIDITIFDLNTFDRVIKIQNDLSYLELFFLPKQHQIINHLVFPQVNIQKLRESLGFHLSKCKMKMQRFKNDPTKKWKILKAVHLKMRFMNNFLELFEFKQIRDVKFLNKVWERYKEEYLQKGHFEQTLRKFQREANELMKKVRETYQNKRKVGRMEMTTKISQKKEVKKHHKINNKQFQKLMKHEAIQSSSEVKWKENPLHGNLQIVKYLRQYGCQNMDMHQIKMRRGTKHQNLIQFKYLQSASFKSQICRQARGIILDEARNFQVVALPYFKFFDYNDSKYSQLSQFNFKKYQIYEKFDGSISFLYFYGNEWHVASASVPDGENNYCFARKQTTIQFRKQFWRIFNDLKYSHPFLQDKNKTFIFQLMSKNHIIVVNRQQDQLVLHGVRNIDTLQEEDPMIFGQKYGWKYAKPVQLQLKNPLDPIEQLIQLAQKLDPLVQEGFVLCDDKRKRIKLKSSNYIRVNWLGQLNITQNKDPSRYILIQIILAGEADSFRKYCPEWEPVISQFCNKISKLNSRVLEVFQGIKDLKDKQFVNAVKKQNHHIQHFLFTLRANYYSYRGRIEHCMPGKKLYNFLKDLKVDEL